MADGTSKRGLTLIEMLVVVGVIATLAAMVIVATRRVENQSSENIVANAFALYKAALREYYEEMGRFPPQYDKSLNTPDWVILSRMRGMYDDLASVPACREILKGIDTILVQRQDKQPAEARLYDPWGTPLYYIYDSRDTFPELISAGPDKKFGTADDISSKGK